MFDDFGRETVASVAERILAFGHEARLSSQEQAVNMTDPLRSVFARPVQNRAIMASGRARKELDKIDRGILNELSDDARIPFAELARKVGLSRNALRNRVAKLEADTVISKYTIERGDGKANGEKTVGLIMIDRRDRMRGADVTLALKNIPEVKTCYVLSGKFDLIVQVEVEDAGRLKEICSEIWELPGVQDTRTNFVLSTIVDRR